MSAVLLLVGCSGPEDSRTVSSPQAYTISGTVMAPVLHHHLFSEPTQVSRLIGFLFRPLAAAITGVEPITGTTVELLRLDIAGNVVTVLESTISDGSGTYTFSSTEAPSSLLAVRVTGVGADGFPVEMRALVTAEVGITLSPLSEAVTDAIVDYLASSGVWLDSYTINEVALLNDLVNDLDIDIGGLGFDEAIAKITAIARPLLDDLIVGFAPVGEELVFDEFETYNLLEFRPSFIMPNATYAWGANEYYGSIGGGVTFDNNGLVTGSGIYYWRHLTDFETNQRFRLVDEAVTNDVFIQYPEPIGFDRIVVGAEGKAITGASDGESTAYGFMSNDSKLLGFPVNKDDRLASKNNYDVGMRILMRKFTRYDGYGKVDTRGFGVPSAGVDTNTGGTTSTVSFNNDILDDPSDEVATVYNVVTLQHFMDGNGIEIAVSTSTYDFDSSQQLTVSDGSDPGTLTHGRITPTFNFNTRRLTTKAVAAIEASTDSYGDRFEPTLFTVIEGGVLMLRRESSFYIHAATGAVAEDGQYFIAPQIFDNTESDVNLSHNTNGRRGWYVGVRQSTGLTNAHIVGKYNAVGVVTHLTTANGGTVKHENIYGTVEFDGSTDGDGNGNIAATLYSRSIALNGLDGSVVGALTVTPETVPTSYIGTYNVSAADGSFTTFLQETITNFRTKQVTGAVSADGQFIVLPIRDNATRGILILSHVRVKTLDMPPDPPGPPDAPFDTPPSLLPPG